MKFEFKLFIKLLRKRSACALSHSLRVRNKLKELLTCTFHKRKKFNLKLKELGI